MPCRTCQSEKQRSYDSEIAIHFPGLKNLSKPAVFVFPRLLVCLDCGFTEFVVADAELEALAEDIDSKQSLDLRLSFA